MRAGRQAVDLDPPTQATVSIWTPSSRGPPRLPARAVLSATIEIADPKALPDLVDRLKGKLPDAAIVLGGALDGRVHLIVGVTPPLVARGVKAGAIVKAAAAVVGGGGGGRDTLAQAGGRDVERLDEALAAGRSAIEAATCRQRPRELMRVLGLDYGSAPAG